MGKNTVQGYFNANASAWLARYHNRDFDSVTFQDRLEAGLDLLKRFGHKNMSILDAGCGTGISTLALLLSGHRAIGCDISIKMAKQASDTIVNAALPNAEMSEVIVADLQNCPFRDGALDGILMLGVLGFTDNPDKVLDEVRRMLKTGGLLVVSSASQKLILERISDVVSYIPSKVYLFLKMVTTGERPSQVARLNGFYAENLCYHDPREFDKVITKHQFRRLSSRAVNFGEFSVIGKKILPEHWSIGLSRFIGIAARIRVFQWLERHARHYVVCMEKI